MDGNAAGGAEAEESKRAAREMETEGGEEEGQGGHRHPASHAAKKRLTMDEFQSQYATRISTEFEVFRFAIAKVETILDKNAHMHRFIFRLFREVETSFVTTAEQPQCAL